MPRRKRQHRRDRQLPVAPLPAHPAQSPPPSLHPLHSEERTTRTTIQADVDGVEQAVGPRTDDVPLGGPVSASVGATQE